MPSAINPAAAEAYKSETDDFDLVVTFDVQGQRRRFAARALTARARDGEEVAIDGGLMDRPTVPQRAVDVANPGVTVGGEVSITLQSKGADWLRALSSRYPLQCGTVELAMLPINAWWDDREVLHLGTIRAPSWDARAGVASVQVMEVASTGRGRVPDRVVVAGQLPSQVTARSLGEPMQVLYGSQVYDIAGIVMREAANDNRLLVAGHHVRTTASAITVHRDDSTGSGSNLTKTAVNGVDPESKPMSWVVLTDAEYWQDTPTNTKPWSFRIDAPGRQGATPGAAAQKDLHLLGEVLLDLLTVYGALGLDRINVDSFRALDRTLPLDVSIQMTDEDEVVSWVQKIVADLPVAVEWSGGRLTCFGVVLGADRAPSYAAQLNWGRELYDLAGRYQEDSVEDIANDFTVKYGYRNKIQRYSQNVVMNPTSNAWCRASAAKYGARALSQSINLWMIEDAATANLIARELVARYAFLRTRCSYVAETRAVSHLDPGDVVEITDVAQGVIAQPFIIESIDDPNESTTTLGLASFRELEVTG